MDRDPKNPQDEGYSEPYQDTDSLSYRYGEFVKGITENGYSYVLNRYNEAILMIAQTRDNKQNQKLEKELEKSLKHIFEGTETEPHREAGEIDKLLPEPSYQAYLSIVRSTEAERTYQEGYDSKPLDLDQAGTFFNEAFFALQTVDPALLNCEAIFNDYGYHRSVLDKHKLRVSACKAVGLDRNDPILQLTALSWLATLTRQRMMRPLRDELHAMRVEKTFTKFKSKFDTELTEEELYWRKLLVQQGPSERGSEFYRGYYARIEQNRARLLEGIPPHLRPELETLVETLAYMKPLRQLGRPVPQLLREALAPAADGDYGTAIDGLAAIIARSEQSLPRFASDILKAKVAEQRSIKWQQDSEDAERRKTDSEAAMKAANQKAMIEIWNNGVREYSASETVKELEAIIGLEFKNGPIQIRYEYTQNYKAEYEHTSFDRWIKARPARTEVHAAIISLGELIKFHGEIGVKPGVEEGHSRTLQGIIKELKKRSVVKIEATQMSIEEYAESHASQGSSGLAKYRREAIKKETEGLLSPEKAI